MPTFSYDSEIDALAITLREGAVNRTVELGDGVHLVDVDSTGLPLRIEVLDTERMDLDFVGHQLGLDLDEVHELNALVGGLLPRPVIGTTNFVGWISVSTSGTVRIDSTSHQGHSRVDGQDLEVTIP